MTKVHMLGGASNSWVGDGYSQLLVDQIVVMLEKENGFYSCVDYLEGLPASSDLIDEGWRQKAAEWMFKVIDFYVSEAFGLFAPGCFSANLSLLCSRLVVRIWIETL